MSLSRGLQKVTWIASLVGVLASVAFADSGLAGGGRSGAPQATAPVATESPKQLEGVGIDEKLGQSLDLSLKFRDETGAEVTLGQYFDGKTPVIISPVYYSCPGLCNFHLNGLIEGLKGMEWTAGQQFRVLAVSFDSKETPDLAAKKKDNYMKMYERPGAEVGWHFLTGDEASVKALTEAIGFRYKWSEADQEWSHASAAIIASPKGTITRYLPGILFEPRDLRLALTEGGRGQVGTFVDQLVLYCFQYNPHQSRYTASAFQIMKLGGGLTVVILALWLLPTWFRARRESMSARRA